MEEMLDGYLDSTSEIIIVLSVVATVLFVLLIVSVFFICKLRKNKTSESELKYDDMQIHPGPVGGEMGEVHFDKLELKKNQEHSITQDDD